MSIAALGGAAIRLGGPAALGGIKRLLGRKGRQRARAAAGAVAAVPSIAQRAIALTGRLAGVRGLAAAGVMPRRRRRRGITAAEIRGFKKLSRLLSQFGMRPRGLARPMARGRRPFSRARFGDPDFGDFGDE